MLHNIIITLCLSIFSLNINAQEYCIKFSKENKSDVLVKSGKRLSYVLQNEAKWKEGVVYRVSKDSIFFEAEKESKLFIEDDNVEILAYGINEFRMMAYPKTSTIARGTGLIVALVASTVLTAGALLLTTNFEANDSIPPLKIFKREVDVEDGWKIEIIPCLSSKE